MNKIIILIPIVLLLDLFIHITLRIHGINLIWNPKTKWGRRLPHPLGLGITFIIWAAVWIVVSIGFGI